MGATVWSLWSRNKWWVLLPSPLFLPSSFCVTFWKTKIHQSLISLLNMTPATWDRHRLYSSLCSFSSGGWSELSAAGDLWDWEQIQQPRIKGKHQTARECFSLRASVTASDVTWQFGKKMNHGPGNCSSFYLQVADDEISDNSAECVVCLSDVRDTLILPCRHLCLCNACADTLRYQANCCPICRLREFTSAMNTAKSHQVLFLVKKKKRSNQPKAFIVSMSLWIYMVCFCLSGLLNHLRIDRYKR